MIYSGSLVYGAFILEYYCIKFSLTGLTLYRKKRKLYIPYNLTNQKYYLVMKQNVIMLLLKFIPL